MSESLAKGVLCYWDVKAKIWYVNHSESSYFSGQYSYSANGPISFNNRAFLKANCLSISSAKLAKFRRFWQLGKLFIAQIWYIRNAKRNAHKINVNIFRYWRTTFLFYQFNCHYLWYSDIMSTYKCNNNPNRIDIPEIVQFCLAGETLSYQHHLGFKRLIFSPKKWSTTNFQVAFCA